jgi:phosphate transport system permease protein
MQLDTSARPSIAGPNASELGGSIKAGSGKSFDRKNRLLFYNRFFKLACIASAVFVCLILFGILFLMFRTGVLTFRDVSPMTFFFSTDWTPEDDRYGAFVFIFGTFALTLLTLLISVPLSVVIAVFLAEVAPTWLRNLLRPVLDHPHSAAQGYNRHEYGRRHSGGGDRADDHGAADDQPGERRRDQRGSAKI